MEYCPKGLWDDKQPGQVFSEAEAAKIMQQCLSAMIHYMLRNLIHRDIKPDNIMFGTDGNVRLCDFGVSSSLHKDEKEHSEIGSRIFMAPEIFLHNYNKQCDVWSLGVTLYHMVTGNYAFSCKDGTGYMIKAIKKGIYPPLPKELSESLRNLIGGMLLVDPEKRLTVA